MESKPQILKYIFQDSNKFKFQLDVEQTENPNFVFTSFSYFSTGFGPFAYNDKYQEVNICGKLIFNTEKSYYELYVETGKIEVRPQSILGFSSGPCQVWEGESFKEIKERLDKSAIRFYNDAGNRFDRNPEPSVILTRDNMPQFCRFNIQHRDEYRLGDYWLVFEVKKEGYCLIF